MINKLIKLYCVALPLNVFSVFIGGYPFTIPVVVSIFLLLALIVKNRSFNARAMMLLILLLLFAFSTTTIVHGIGKDTLSLGLLALMALPVTFYFKKKDVQNFEKFLKIGFLITIPFVIYDLGVTALGLPPLEELSILFSNATNSPLSSYFGYYRVKSTFTEPSYYAIYLVTVFYVLMDLRKEYKSSLSNFIIVFVILTVSLTGFILLGLVFLIYLIRQKRIAYKYLIPILVALIVLPTFSELIINRLINTFYSIGGSSYYGSESVRANSLVVMFDYLSEQNFLKFLIGEGYGHYDKWLIDKFGGNPLIAYSRGQIFNAFAVIGMSLGFIGLIIYLSFFISLGTSRDFNAFEIFYHVVIQFSLAFIVGYLFWSVLMLIKFKNTLLKTDTNIR